jgi:transcriptional regulator with XRE-family HTH domain
MGNREEIRDFLTTRRARIRLRREEVARLAGVSADYYTRLERGNAQGAPDSVLEALARALQLDEAERAYLFDLVRAANGTAATRAAHRAARPQVRPSVQRILDSMASTPALVRNRHLDILAANRLGRALYSPVLTSPAQPANPARFMFADPGARDFYLDWERQARDMVAMLRAESGRNPHDRGLSGLIGELSTRSQAFRTWWDAHHVRVRRTGVKRLHHPVVGDLTLTCEALDLAADAGLRINAFTAEPGSPSDDALNLLASWAATIDRDAVADA